MVSQVIPMEELERSVGAMCRVLRHGGPDGEGIYSCPEYPVVLGHRRLAILDLAETGRQPMQYEDGRYTISFNGEVYNFPELRTELEGLGHRFRSTGDTEVILAAFAAWGTASFARLNGMFAFALLDREAGTLYLVRDCMGVKPLYYYLHQKALVFASEVRAFAQAPVRLVSDPTWPVFLMAYGHLPEPVTTYKGVQPLPKGSFLKYDVQEGRSKVEPFDRLSYYEKAGCRDEILEQIRGELDVAVRRHLLSDAPIGVFLSGGVDSSVLALVAGEAVGEQLNTLSLHFREEGYSEKTYQEQMARKIGSVHHQVELTAAAFHRNLPEIIEAMDLPSSDGINTWFISRITAQSGLKAVLSGLGGDELFGGYPSFHRIRATERLRVLPAATLRAGRFIRTKFRRLAYLSLSGIKGEYLFLRGLFIPPSIARYLDMDEAEVWRVLEEQPVLPDLGHLSPGNKASWIEMNLYMQNQLLRDADTMSMAHGVELRVPFLDKGLVKLVLSLPAREKYSGAMGKQLLIDAFRRELPPEVWQRKKMGFSFPFAEWLKEDEWVRSKLSNGDLASLSALKKFDEGRLHWSGLITLLLLRTHQHETTPAFFDA